MADVKAIFQHKYNYWWDRFDKQSWETRINWEKHIFKLNKPSETKSDEDFTQTNQTKLSQTEMSTKQTQKTKSHQN